MFEVYPENVESFREIIDNYETIVKELNQELQTLKDEQDNLKVQLTDVLVENSRLANTLQGELSSKEKRDEYYNNENNKEIITNLKDQVDTLITEKEYVTKLWQEGVKIIDHLEDEVKILRAGTQSFIPKKEFQEQKVNYENKVRDLETQLKNAQRTLEDTIEQTKAKIEVKHCEVDQSLENQVSALKIVKNLESEVLKLQKRLEEAVDDKIHLEKCLENKEDIIQDGIPSMLSYFWDLLKNLRLKKTNSDCLRRVTEAVGLIEAALNEKDAALFREKQIKEENEKLVQEMTTIVRESQDKIRQEALKISDEHQERQKKTLDDLARAHSEIKNKLTEIEDLNKKITLLENDIDKMHRGHCSIGESEISKMLILEKNLESTFQKLLLCEKQNIQVISDKEAIKNDLEQMADIYERNLKSKEIEIATLKSKVSRLEVELEESHGKAAKVMDRVAQLNEEIERREKDFKEQKDNYEMLMKTRYDSKINEITIKFTDNMNEMQNQLEKKQEIYQKWRRETKTITENLEKVIHNLKQQVQTLKKEKKMMRESLSKSEEKIKQYKVFLELISKDVNKLSHLTISGGIS